MVEDETVVFQLWDTAGQEKLDLKNNSLHSLHVMWMYFRFRNALTPVYLRRADAFVIVYDVTSQKSFKSIKSWLSIVSVSYFIYCCFYDPPQTFELLSESS